MLRRRGVSSLIFESTNRHPQDGIAEEYHQFSLRKLTATDPTLTVSQGSTTSREFNEPFENDAAIAKEQLRDAKKVYAWTDWVASIFGDLTDICFALQPFFHLSLLFVFPYVGLVPVMLGFAVKWFFAIFQMTKEFDDNNKEEGGWLMRRMVIVLAPPIIVLSFITVVAVLSKPVMMVTVGVSIAVEIAYLICNVNSSVARFFATKKEIEPAKTAFYASLSQEQCDYLHQDSTKLHQLVAASFAHYNSRQLRGFVSDKEQLNMYKTLCHHAIGEQKSPTNHSAHFLSPEQLRLYTDVVNADRRKRKRKRDIADRSHILVYSLLQLTGAVLAGLALICPPLLLPGCVLLAAFGTWALVDKVNYHPFKWVMNKLFDNILEEEQHGNFNLKKEKLPFAPTETRGSTSAPATPHQAPIAEQISARTSYKADTRLSASHDVLLPMRTEIRHSKDLSMELVPLRNLSPKPAQG